MSTNWQPRRRLVLLFSRVMSSELRICSEVMTGPISGRSRRQPAKLSPMVVPSTTIGDSFAGCRLDLPEIGPVMTSLQIRNSLDMTLLNNKTNRRLGCQFIDISRGNLAAVQRYITKL